jgi:outer membrane lipoprotein-sorting protein
MKYVIRILLLGLTTSICSAFGYFAIDAAKQDIAKMNATYSKAQKLSLSFDLKMYDHSNKMVQQSSGCYYMDGKNIYTEYMGKKVLVNGHCFVCVDENSRTLVYNKPDKRQKSFGLVPLGLNDSLIHKAKGVFSYVEKNNKQRKIKLQVNDETYSSFTVGINLPDYSLRSFGYTIKNEGEAYSRVEITYPTMHINKNISADIFDENKLIEMKNGMVKGKGLYKSFEVIDQTKVKWD